MSYQRSMGSNCLGDKQLSDADEKRLKKQKERATTLKRKKRRGEKRWSS